MHLWDRLLPQAIITVNLLKTYRINPKLLAYEYLHSTFDYNTTPLAPPGTKVLIHEKVNQRTSWGLHSREGWYLGPAMHHYCCYACYTIETRAECIADIIDFHPHAFDMPHVTPEDTATAATLDLIEALRNPGPRSPWANLGNEQLQAIKS
eukprot:4617276-Ditylum_brightwellii.AAC.1